jgi:hypothetical protein
VGLLKKLYIALLLGLMVFGMANATVTFTPSPSSGSQGVLLAPTLQATIVDTTHTYYNVSFIDNSTKAVICMVLNQSNNTLSSCMWFGLTANTTYTWYLSEVNGTTTNSSVYNFTTLTASGNTSAVLNTSLVGSYFDTYLTQGLFGTSGTLGMAMIGLIILVILLLMGFVLHLGLLGNTVVMVPAILILANAGYLPPTLAIVLYILLGGVWGAIMIRIMGVR